MLLITHDMGVVATTCDDVAVIYAGSIIEYGTKEQIFDHPSHPYTIGLFGAIPNMNEDEEWLHLSRDFRRTPPICPKDVPSIPAVLTPMRSAARERSTSVSPRTAISAAAAIWTV